MVLRIWTRLTGTAVLALLAVGTGVAHADDTTSQTSHSITAVGNGVVEGIPNVLELSLGSRPGTPRPRRRWATTASWR